MYIILNAEGAVAAVGGRDLATGPGQALVPVLDAETANADNALAAIGQARDATLAAFQARASAADVGQLVALDAALIAALRALTTAQIDAVRAGAALAKAEQGVRDDFARAEQDAARQHGERGEVWWDGQAFQTRERAVDPAETALLAEAQELVTRASANPDLALAIRAMFGVDPTNLDAMIGAMKGRRQG